MKGVIAGVMGGLAGVLLANHNLFVSPAMMHWTASASLIIMVIVGGIGQDHDRRLQTLGAMDGHHPHLVRRRRAIPRDPTAPNALRRANQN